jgi:hypothetical protein
VVLNSVSFAVVMVVMVVTLISTAAWQALRFNVIFRVVLTLTLTHAYHAFRICTGFGMDVVVVHAEAQSAVRSRAMSTHCSPSLHSREFRACERASRHRHLLPPTNIVVTTTTHHHHHNNCHHLCHC